ncbi:MAG: phenylalanine--tRNA ligase subunit beta [Spirochaetes bacterium]|nr:phenylalanine--tRNA ligase subunit beta [Spirochaetota bacterium]
MPKIEIIKKDFDKQILTKLSGSRLEKILECAKAELKGLEDGIYKIEFNDTNRPDLWTCSGLARQINQYLGLKDYSYPFFKKAKPALQIKVDSKVKSIRPFIVGFGARDIRITEEWLLELIQNQEKLCMSFGHARRDIAIGIYKLDRIRFPVLYKAIRPSDIKYVPLGMDEEMDLAQILEKHPKGIEFGHIVKNKSFYPIIVDRTSHVLSFPPIINSRYIGEVQTGDKEVFVEITGTDLRNLLLVANMLACDLYDRGATIIPLKVKYPYATLYGQEVQVPYHFNHSIKVLFKQFETIIGNIPSKQDIKTSLKKMGYKDPGFTANALKCTVPDFRHDIMHPVDVIEDYTIGKGFDYFKPEMPSEFTLGSLSQIELFSDNVREVVVGQGYQEIISNILNSSDNMYYRMNIPSGSNVEIANPMTESYNLLRKSIIPSLLEVESVSAKAEYPHKIFEVGEVLIKAGDENYGTKTLVNLGMFSAHPRANFSEMRSAIDSLFYYLNIKDYDIQQSPVSFLIPGRSAEILAGNVSLGYLGEVHPDILSRWDINMPAVVAEINLDKLVI